MLTFRGREMRVIIEHYHGEKFYEIQEVAEKDLARLNQIEKYVEMNFQMQIKEENQLPDLPEFENQSMLFATIGKKQQSKRVDVLYNMDEEQLQVINKKRPLKQTYWISCYGEDETLQAATYIRCIEQLVKWAKMFERPLVIYSQLEAKEQYYRYRSLTEKIVNHLLEQVNGVLVRHKAKAEIASYYMPSHKAFEFYIEKGVYLSCAYEEMIRRIVACMDEANKCDFRQVYRIKRQEGSLYDDLFYEMIPNEEKIYVPISDSSDEVSEYIQGLGLEVIKGTDSTRLIYDTKSKINSYANELKPYVNVRYECPILERETLNSEVLEDTNESYNVTQENLDYKGNGVYIAIISEEGIDYRLDTLRNSDGTTRIAGIWYQEEGIRGILYTREQINTALVSDRPEEVVPIDANSNENTMLLTIAGGKNERYTGVASQAEFIIAKVNSASFALQAIYGGMPNARNILMPDLMVGIWEVEQFARRQNKPVIFYTPYYANVDGHDGLSFYNTLIAYVSVKAGHAVIVPTGEEGDKRHHQTLYNGTVEEPVVNLQVGADLQNIVGLFTQRYLSDWQIILTSPGGQKIEITNAGTYAIEDAIIYSQGEKPNYYNGIKEVMFRLSNLNQGTWQLEVQIQNKIYNRVDLWISGEASNPSVRLFPQNPYVTIGSVGNIASVTSVAGYNLEQLATLRGSGRGYTVDDRIKPNLAAGGILETISVNGERMKIEGIEVSAIFIAGVAATIFEKWLAERGMPLLNGPLLNSILLEYLTRYTNSPFPNPNQGYGIFEKEALNQILFIPFNA